METRNEYEEDIRIDGEMLEFEWMDQPMKMLKYCEKYASAIKQESFAKENLDICKAELDKAIRTTPESFGITGKITEETVKSTILLQADYIAANHAYIEASYEAEMAKGAVRAFDQRKDALENMVRLHGQSYFAGPKVPHDYTSTKDKWKKSDNPKIHAMPIMTRKH